MNNKVKYILDVWGCYRITTLLLLMVILLAFAGLGCSSTSGAGFGRDPQPKSVDDQMALLTERLHLTSEQQTQVRPIIESACEKQSELLEKARGQDRSARRELHSEMQAIATNIQEQLSSILTPEQMKSYEELMEEQRTARPERMKGRKGGRR